MPQKIPFRNFKYIIVAAFMGLTFIFLGWMYYPNLLNPGPHLAFKVEGFLQDKINFRDTGASINACAGKKIMPEGRLFRASSFFSGWSCDKVGQPDVIYSLNYSDAENQRYYCRGSSSRSDGFNVGRFFQKHEISDIEFLSTWDRNPEQVRSVCRFLEDGLKELKNNRKILVHCEAGRDRTGAVSALIAAYELEGNGQLSNDQIEALECDYQKSKSLVPEKYGRIKSLLESLRAQGGVRSFVKSRCGLSFNDI